MNQSDHLLKYSILVILSILFLFFSIKYSFGRTYYGIERPKLGGRILYEFERETRDGPDIDTEDILHDQRMQLEVETGGWIYHSALCEYNLRLFPELSLRKEEHNSESKSKDSILQGYFADAVFLQYKPYSLRLFGQRTDVPVRSAFATTSDIETDTYGADLNLNFSTHASTSSYSHLKESQTGFFSSDEDIDQFRFSGNQNIGGTNISLNSTYEEKTRTSASITNESKRLDSDLRNNFKLTNDGSIILRSYMSQRETEIGESKTSGFRINETLDWRHRENLRTDYHLDYNKNKTDFFFNDILSMRAGLEHLLYENLTTRLLGEVTLNDFTEGNANTYSGDINLNYHRRIPWGDLFILTSRDYTRTNRSINAEFVQVINEAHSLTTGDLTLLGNQNVDIDSIQLTDITGTTVYIEDIDYRIEEIDSFVRIGRTTFGSIANGEEVLVSYRYRSNPDFDDERLSYSYGFRLYLWSLFSLTYDYTRADQSVISGIPPENLIDDTAHMAAMELERDYTYTKLSYEDIDRQSGISFTKWEANEKLTFRPFWQLFFGLEGSYGEREFKKSKELENFSGLRAFADYTPFASSKFSIEGSQYKVSGDSQKNVNKGLLTVFEILFGNLTGRIKYKYLTEEDTIVGETREFHNILVEIVAERF